MASILMEKLSLFLHLIKCLWKENACAEVFFNSDVVWLYFLYKNHGILSKLNDK